jgi:hypothetical protein
MLIVDDACIIPGSNPLALIVPTLANTSAMGPKFILAAAFVTAASLDILRKQL